MAKVNKVYLVIMYRGKARDNHHYFLGIFDKKDRAIEEAEKEKEYRGGTKYFPEIFEYDLNMIKTGQIIYELEQD